ncbi:unnamed protein product [Somion occarium]|uniref:Fungal-type protein kinase domain-containing protein n=1 Tax=Somion occarium TaxID=3059160 RepID=A0ABP1CNC3_9APHY
MADRWGEIELGKLMSEYVPGPNPTEDELKTFAKFDEIVISDFTGPENHLYGPLCRVINSVLGPSMTCKDTSEFPEESRTRKRKKNKTPASKEEKLQDEHAFRFKPDLSIFRTSADAQYALTDKDKKGSTQTKERLQHAGRTSWHAAIALGEGKTSIKDTPFRTGNGGPLLRDTKDAHETRGQMAQYAAELMLRQHRQHVFFVSFFQDTMRIIRWDRNGALVSTPFNYKENPEMLWLFFYRIKKMNDEALGFDTTVRPAEAEKIEEMKAYVSDYVKNEQNPEKLKSYVKKIFEDDWPIFRMDVPDGDGLKHVYIGKHLAGHRSTTGRATRGYIAYDPAYLDTETGETGPRLVFAKDTWRPDTDKIHPEIEVYSKLHAANVPNIATLISGGDVVANGNTQRTRTQEVLDNFLPRIHYRILFKEIGRPLDTYRESLEMIQFIGDAIEAHEAAWLLAGVLHRDVSEGNILINDTPEGGSSRPKAFLNDWDLCKYRDEIDDEATQIYRSGTWRYMSALLLNYHTKRQVVSDDLESFIHVVIILVLRHHDHSLSRRSDLLKYMEDYYDHYDRSVEGHHLGSLKKRDMFLTKSLGFKVLHNPNLALFVRSLVNLCHKHYNALDFDKFQEPTRQLPAEPKVFPDSDVAKESVVEHHIPRPDADDEPNVEPPRGQENVENQVLRTHNSLLQLFRGAPLWSVNEDTLEKWLKDKQEQDAFRNMYAESRGPQASLFCSSTLTTSNTQINDSTSANTAAERSDSKGKKRSMLSEDSVEPEAPSVKRSRKSHGPSLLAGPSSVNDGVFMISRSEDQSE